MGSLTLADTPTVDLTRAVSYLQNYPYGCLEQTVSKAWPFLVLPEAIAEIDPLLFNNQAVREKLDSALARIQSMQIYDGSFTMWPGSAQPYNWGSVYTAHFLVEARKAGISYPEDMLKGSLNWLKQFLASLPSSQTEEAEKDDFTSKAYAAYVLTLYGEKPLGWLEYLKENSSNMWPSGKIWLAGATALIEGRPDALRELGVGGGSFPARARAATLESQVRNTAQLLNLWLAVDPQSKEASKLAGQLVKWGEENRWYSPQDNSTVLLSLARYSQKVTQEKAKLKTSVTTQEGENLLDYVSGKTSALDISRLPETFSLVTEGTGKGYYSWNALGIPNEKPKPESKGLQIQTSWLLEDGNPADLSKPIPRGQKLKVVLLLTPTLPVSNLAVSCLLPAGFEPENSRLSDISSQLNGANCSLRQDVRDDRVLFFVDRLDKELSLSFDVRAVTSGTFAVPPVSAEGMYDPEVYFVGETPAPLVIE